MYTLIIMSASLASARKRRAPAANDPTPSTPTPSQQSQQAGFTLPQVITLIDKRLITLEQFMKSQEESATLHGKISNELKPQNVSVSKELPSNINEIVEEFNSRYVILAEEIDNLKNIVLNLQSYTMEVNKTLMEERVRVLSEVDNVRNIKIDEKSENSQTLPSNNIVEYLEEITEELKNT